MPLTPRKIVFLLSLAGSLGGLMMDRTVLSGGPRGAAASLIALDAAPPSTGDAASDAAVRDALASAEEAGFASASRAGASGTATPEKLAVPPVTISLAQRLAGISVNSVPSDRDAFALPSAWAALAQKVDASAASPKPSAPTEAATFSPRLTAVMIAPNARGAKLDGSLVRLGQEYQGWTLVKVEPRSVTLRKDDRELEVKLSAREP